MRPQTEPRQGWHMKRSEVPLVKSFVCCHVLLYFTEWLTVIFFNQRATVYWLQFRRCYQKHHETLILIQRFLLILTSSLIPILKASTLDLAFITENEVILSHFIRTSIMKNIFPYIKNLKKNLEYILILFFTWYGSETFVSFCFWNTHYHFRLEINLWTKQIHESMK